MQPLNNTEVVAKADFARLVGVSRGRVSQWIAEGKISGDALDGSGRKARSGWGTPRRSCGASSISASASETASTPASMTRLRRPQRRSRQPRRRYFRRPSRAATLPAEAAIEDRIKRERLEQLQRANRKLAEEEAARAGRYVLAADVAQQLGSALARQLAWVDGVLSELATAMTVKFGISQRDALYLLRTEFHACRARGSVQFKAQGYLCRCSSKTKR